MRRPHLANPHPAHPPFDSPATCGARVILTLGHSFFSPFAKPPKRVYCSQFAAFPDASNMAIQYIMQSAMIGAFVVSLAISALTTRFRKKPLILTGLVVMFLGGLVPVINHSQIWLLDLCGFLVGAGQGFLVPLVGSLILENFVGRGTGIAAFLAIPPTSENVGGIAGVFLFTVQCPHAITQYELTHEHYAQERHEAFRTASLSHHVWAGAGDRP